MPSDPHPAAAKALRVWQVCDSLAVTFGGISAACAHLTNHLARAGARVTAISLDETTDSPLWPLDASVDAVRCAASWTRVTRVGYSRGLAARLSLLTPPDVVHLHGLWRGHFAQAAGYARRAGVPVILTVHGMLHPPALRQRRAFKRLAGAVFQDRVLREARCLHATASAEADEIRSLGIDRPIAVIPWGVELPGEAASAHPAASGEASGSRVLLFLGRLHPTKGLDTLLRAWARVFRQFPSWRLVLAGYDEGHYGVTLTALAAELGLGDSLSFAGPVDAAGRDRLMAGADLLVLPSPSENFGLVVPEALASGVPVIATQGAPWPMLVSERCGWWIPVGEDPLAAALADAFSRPPAALREMGQRGRQVARAHFTWQTVTASMLALYGWARGAAPQPAFVQP